LTGLRFRQWVPALVREQFSYGNYGGVLRAAGGKKDVGLTEKSWCFWVRNTTSESSLKVIVIVGNNVGGKESIKAVGRKYLKLAGLWTTKNLGKHRYFRSRDRTCENNGAGVPTIKKA